MIVSTKMVEFFAETAVVDGLGRLGLISKWSRKAADLRTPLCLLHTRSGHVPHLSHDLLKFADISPEKFILNLNLSSFVHSFEAISKFDRGLNAYFGLPENCFTLLSVHDPSKNVPKGANHKDSISVDAVSGRYRVGTALYNKILDQSQVDCAQIMADCDLHHDSAQKRVDKALDRSETFLKEICINSHIPLFGTVTGGFNEISRTKWCSTLDKYNLAGYIIDGLHTYGDLSDFKVSRVENLIKQCLTSLNSTDSTSKLTICFGAYDPWQIFQLINLHIDVFDSSYAYLLTESHKALCINYETFDPHSPHGWYTVIDIKNDKFVDDFEKLSENCDCYTCRKYTKAYLYHLFKTEELLEYNLLMIHNLYQYTKYFEFLRSYLRREIDKAKKKRKLEDEEDTLDEQKTLKRIN